MSLQTPESRNEDAKRFLDPIRDDVVLPLDMQEEFQRCVENGDYVDALVIAIYFG